MDGVRVEEQRGRKSGGRGGKRGVEGLRRRERKEEQREKRCFLASPQSTDQKVATHGLSRLTDTEIPTGREIAGLIAMARDPSTEGRKDTRKGKERLGKKSKKILLSVHQPHSYEGLAEEVMENASVTMSSQLP